MAPFALGPVHRSDHPNIPCSMGMGNRYLNCFVGCDVNNKVACAACSPSHAPVLKTKGMCKLCNLCSNTTLRVLYLKAVRQNLEMAVRETSHGIDHKPRQFLISFADTGTTPTALPDAPPLPC